MSSMRRIELLLIGGALAALPLGVSAQLTGALRTTASASTHDATGTTVSADRLIQKYAVLAGSEENAQSLVTGLRNGTEVTLTSGSGDVTRFTPPTGKMGYGNVNIVLALADAQLSKISNPTDADLQNALMNGEDGILTLRAQHMGWGRIANTLGYRLGDLMRASPAKESAGAAVKAERASSQRVARDATVHGGRPDITPSVDRPQRIERPEIPQRIERPEKPQRPERGGR